MGKKNNGKRPRKENKEETEEETNKKKTEKKTGSDTVPAFDLCRKLVGSKLFRGAKFYTPTPPPP